MCVNIDLEKDSRWVETHQCCCCCCCEGKRNERGKKEEEGKNIYTSPSGYIDREKVLAVIILSGRWRINDPPTPSSSSPAKLAAL
jgi:hypothetical protein